MIASHITAALQAGRTRKHSAVEAVIDYQTEIRADITGLEHFKGNLELLKKQVGARNDYQKYEKICKELEFVQSFLPLLKQIERNLQATKQFIVECHNDQ